jgi:hypothetical protein
LEADWNGRLRALAEAQEEYQRQRTADRVAVDTEHRERILALAADFPAIWRDPNTPQRERKRMLALLVEDVTLLKQRQVTAHVRFRGGATTTLTVPRPLTAWERRATSAETRQHMNALLDEYTDAQVAAVLNARGLRTGAGDVFDSGSVQWVRFSAGLTSFKERLIAAGMFTGAEIAAKLGVRRTTIGRWRRQGRLTARICNGDGRMAVRSPARPCSPRYAPERTHGAGCQGQIPCRRCSMKSVPSRLRSLSVRAVPARAASWVP